MHEYIDNLYEICETLNRDLEETNGKIRQSNGKMTGSDLEYVDKLTHAIKSVKTTIAMMEAEDDGGYSGAYGNGMSYERGGRDGNRGGGGRSYRGGSYARGRTGNVRRDSMGRYSRAADDMTEKLEELMENAPNEQIRTEIQRLMNKVENMM